MFFKVVKSIWKREENYNSTEIMRHDGKATNRTIRNHRKMEKYFKELFNLLGQYCEETTQDHKMIELEPEILIDKVARVVKKSPNYKAS